MKIGCFLLSQILQKSSLCSISCTSYYQDLSHISFNQTWAVNASIFYYNNARIGQPQCIKALLTSYAPAPFCIKKGYFAYISSYVTAVRGKNGFLHYK